MLLPPWACATTPEWNKLLFLTCAQTANVFWMFECNQCVLERLFHKAACFVWEFGCGSAQYTLHHNHRPSARQECMTYMNMRGGKNKKNPNNCSEVHYCYRAPLFGASGVPVNKKTESWLFWGAFIFYYLSPVNQIHRLSLKILNNVDSWFSSYSIT